MVHSIVDKRVGGR